MIFGTSPLTFVHVVISLIGIGSGLIVLYGLIKKRRLEAWTAVFLATTVATSVTGFLFPITKVTPGIVVGVVSLVLLTGAVVARYAYSMVGFWRPVYVITAVISLYLNCLVLVVQSFMKVPPLHALAPAGNEPPVMVTQVVMMLAFIVLGVLATIRCKPSAVLTA
jgi:hypothetical protein